MAIMGNPPYSGESVNKGEWITELMEEYKKEPGGKEKLKEKNSKWINDDYVKFIRFSQYFIEKNGEGVVAFINPHGFLDNPTFRGMRWSLLKTFDKIYTIDLHGNNKKKEVSPDGTPDVNVFDIEQGVSINFFVKSGDNDGKALGKVFHYDIFGKRDKKYQELLKTSLDELPFTELETKAPMYYFVPKDYKLLEKYEKSPSLDDIFILSGNGVVTKRDNLCIQDSKDSCFQSAKDIIELEKEVFYKKYKLPNDVRDWKYEWAKKDILENGCDVDKVKEISYRPFDTKYIYYTGRSRGFVGWPVDKVMSHYIRGENIGLLAPKAFKDSRFNHAFVTKNISEAIFLSSLSGSNAMNFPLYVYDQASGVRHSNINTNILDRYESILGMNFSDGITDDNNFSSFDVFKYIYATLHSPSYKNEFNEPLKTGFPRVPFPNSKEMFFRLSKLGALLIDAHLCRNIKNNGNVPDYPVSGSNKVTKRVNASSFEIIDDDNKLGRVWINEEQYFDKVSLVAWNLFVGGYQPAQKWLKDRFGKILSYEEVKYYQMIISSLIETDRISQEIDSIPL
jgi:predicted helicase